MVRGASDNLPHLQSLVQPAHDRAHEAGYEVDALQVELSQADAACAPLEQPALEARRAHAALAQQLAIARYAFSKARHGSSWRGPAVGLVLGSLCIHDGVLVPLDQVCISQGDQTRPLLARAWLSAQLWVRPPGWPGCSWPPPGVRRCCLCGGAQLASTAPGVLPPLRSDECCRVMEGPLQPGVYVLLGGGVLRHALSPVPSLRASACMAPRLAAECV